MEDYTQEMTGMNTLCLPCCCDALESDDDGASASPRALPKDRGPRTSCGTVEEDCQIALLLVNLATPTIISTFGFAYEEPMST